MASPPRLNGDIYRELPGAPTLNDVVDLNTTPGTAGSYTVPADTDSIAIYYNAGVLAMRIGGTAAQPGAAVTNGSASTPVGWGESIPVEPGTVISFQNATACWVTIRRRRTF